MAQSCHPDAARSEIVADPVAVRSGDADRGHLSADSEDLGRRAVDDALAGALPHQARKLEHPLSAQAQVTGGAAGESACRPGSVHPLARAGDHPSRTAVAGSLMRSTREHRAGRPQSLAQEPGLAARFPLDLAPGGVYLAAQVTLSAGGLLHHRFTLTPFRGRSVFCGTIPRVTPGRRYRPPCPAEPGPSSARAGVPRPPG